MKSLEQQLEEWEVRFAAGEISLPPRGGIPPDNSEILRRLLALETV